MRLESFIEVPTMGNGTESLEAVVATCRRAQRRWEQQGVANRLGVVRRLRHTLAAEVLDPGSVSLARPDLVTAAGRIDLAETLSAEVLPLAEALAFLERQAEDLLSPYRPGSSGRPPWLHGVELEVHRQPRGVILVIGPSNYPLFLPGVQALQALVAGNGVLLKPGRGGTQAALALARRLEAAGLPSGLLTVLPEDPEVARQAIAQGVDQVVLTGSAATGREVLEELAPRLVPATLELSGCDAAFVRADADLDRVVDALVFGLRLNDGATCIAPRRALVHSRVAGELGLRLQGAALDLPASTVPVAVAGEARRLAARAVERGARLLAGSLEPTEDFPPLILTDVPPEAEILRADLFAPGLCLVPVAGDDEALAFDELCPYALGASVFGRPAAARALARRIRAGVVVINDVIVPTADPRLPFGGRGESGYGVTRGAEGLLSFTVPKAVSVRRRWRGRLPHLAPRQAGDRDLFRAYLALAHGDWRTRLRAVPALFRALVHRIRRVSEVRGGRPSNLRESPGPRPGDRPEEASK